MPDFRIAQPGLIGTQPITEVSTTAKHPLGTIVKARDQGATAYGDGEFIYLKGVASTLAGSWVTIADNHTTALAVANAVGQVAVAMAALVASRWGWYQISGQTAGKVLTGFAADDGDAYLTATAGSLDDAVVGGDFVCNAVPVSAIGTPSAGLAEFQLNRPFVRNLLDV